MRLRILLRLRLHQQMAVVINDKVRQDESSLNKHGIASPEVVFLEAPATTTFFAIKFVQLVQFYALLAVSALDTVHQNHRCFSVLKARF